MKCRRWFATVLLPLLAGWAAILPPIAAADLVPNPTAATNLVAWCIVPFDTARRGPEARAEMLQRLGLTQLAYDWRAEHIPTFDTEVAALQRHGIHLRAWWFPAVLNPEADAILACIRRHHLHPELWVMAGEPAGADETTKVNAAANGLLPVVRAAGELGCTVGLYNHGGWFGEPENQLAIRARLASLGHTNVGLVYNFHHGHEHLDRFPSLLRQMQPHLLALNLNGMIRDGDKQGRKIIPFGDGDYDPAILALIRSSGYRGPVGILGHTEEDAAVKLQKDLTGLRRIEALLASNPSAPWPAAKRPAGTPAVSGQEPGVQAEKDWVDNRWAQTDHGPALASNVHLPDGSVVARGLTVQLPGAPLECATFDLATGQLRAAWTGGFLKFDATRFGLMGGQKPATTPWFLGDKSSRPLGANYRYLGRGNDTGIVGGRLVLRHEIEGEPLTEVLSRAKGSAGILRRFWVLASTKAKRLTLDSLPDRDVSAGKTGDIHWLKGRLGDVQIMIASAATAITLEPDAHGRPSLVVPPGEKSKMLAIQIVPAGAALPLVTSERGDLFLMVHPAEYDMAKSPPQVLTTRGQRGADTDLFAVDTLTMPYDNPYRALLFASGVDLTPDGIAYVCTMHGDVWQVRGIDDSLRELKWIRYATGLFQPLGLKVRGNDVYVLGRDQITRLSDTDHDGVADTYDTFHDGIATSTGGHDYVTCLEQDQAGNFYYADPLGVHQVSPDGKKSTLLAGGFRNPNGLGANADGSIITVAPQQGTWTPSSGIWSIRPAEPGAWGGFGGPRVTANRPLGYDAPLCWIPHGVDNSSGSQVWVPPGVWGPLGGQMLHLLWGRSGMMLVLRDSSAARPQGAVVPLPVKFLAGPNRASFHGGDLFVAGSTGWQTSALRDGALQRVRWTGKRWLAPIRWTARADGLDLTFAEPLRRETATDAGSFSVKRWNYRYAEQYGSRDWSAAQPSREGRDEVPILASRLSPDGKTLSLDLGAFGPVMQWELKYSLEAADGKTAKGSLWGTLNQAGK